MKRFKKWADPRLAQISLYVIVTFLIIFLLYKALGSTGTVLAALGRGLHWLFVILKPLVTGFAAAYILYPVALFFEKKAPSAFRSSVCFILSDRNWKVKENGEFDKVPD